MNKTIITVVGKNSVGIIAKICTYLANHKVNVLDINQTILHGYFNMMMIVDTTDIEIPFDQLADELTTVGREIGVQVKCQREDIFEKMHRI